MSVMTAVSDQDLPEREDAREGEPAEVRAWVAAAQQGDRVAFEALVHRYHRVVFRTALAALRHREDADDVAQEAMVLAWRKIGGFRGEASFKTWLLTITWRQAVDRRTARNRWWNRLAGPRTADGDGGHEVDALDRVAALAVDQERRAAARQQLERVRHAIASLSPKLRDTLLLASSGEYTYEEIAGMQAIPTGTVKWRVAEARRQLTATIGHAGGAARQSTAGGAGLQSGPPGDHNV
jgi:RNA polymerase sigma-70 factor (ECF subfamily)